ncbi:hypothetical protein [Novosphingobium sp. B 225]|uniref:hypothetical protein n=1 Tax=Novosphingobium sp. B 225 TaxID=1961849 RepID=UPI001124DE75|nr:hypothetical protein [Novosphingobium sp. B 225]
MPDSGSNNSLEIINQAKAIRVAAIIDDFHIVLNVGRDDGIQSVQKFLIYGLGQEITDPETGESLGILEIIRGRGKVVHLQDRFCTIKSIDTRQLPGIKKIVTRNNPFRIAGLGAPPVEEIEEGNRTVDEPFEDAEIGDFARRI